MNAKIFFIVIILILARNNTHAQYNGQNKKVKYFRNDSIIENPNFYLLRGDSAFLLRYYNGILVIPDTISTEVFNLLLIYKKDRVTIFDFYYKEASFLNIYFDNRIFNNKVDIKFGGYSKLKYLFKKRYLIEDGRGDVSIHTTSKKDYILIK